MNHDFAALRKIPILHVAQALGLHLVKTGYSTYAMKEDQEITSLIIFERTNRFHSFSGKESGGVSHGSPIDLVLHVRGCSLAEAADFLTSYFPQCA